MTETFAYSRIASPFLLFSFPFVLPNANQQPLLTPGLKNISMFKYEHTWAFVFGDVSQPGVRNQHE